MADYYPVLKRAISSLPSSSGEARRAVYEKARQALLKQLQSYDPPLSPAEITDQRLQLEESIRRVESEVAGAAFGLTPEPPVPPAQRVAPPPSEPKAPEAKVPEPKTADAKAPDARPPEAKAPEPKPVAPAAASEPKPVAAAPAKPEPVAPKPAPAAPAPAPVLKSEPREPAPAPPPTVAMPKPAPPPALPKAAEPAPAKPAEPTPDARIGAGISALAKTLRQAEQLGDASAKAVRTAREAIEDAPAEPPAGDRKIEPGFMETPLGAELPEPPMEPPKRRLRVERDEGAVLPPRTPERRRSPAMMAALAVLVLAALAAAAFAVVRRDQLMAYLGGDTPAAETTAEVALEAVSTEGLEPKILDRLPQNGEGGTPVAPDARTVTTERVAAPDAEPGTPPPPATDTAAAEPPADTAPPAAAVPPVEPPPAAVADAGTPPGTETPPVAAEPSTEPAPPAIEPPPTTPSTTEPAAGTPPAAAPATAATSDGQVVLVAQRAILYEEPIPGSEGARVEGQVLWTLVNEPVLPGEPPVAQVRAVVEVPDRDVKLRLSLRRNTDQALPASHIAELRFDLGANFSGGAIDTTPGLILKQTEDARGDPMIGAVAKVDENLFWLALSGADQDATRNIALLKERQWIDVPIRYTNRRRAILTFEKGGPGSDAFAKAFAAWGQ